MKGGQFEEYLETLYILTENEKPAKVAEEGCINYQPDGNPIMQASCCIKKEKFL
jgi:hypothetical protein